MMSAKIVQVGSEPSYSVLEFSDPLPAEIPPGQDEGSCRFCVPLRSGNTLTQFEAVPAACLPLPEGARILCPEISVLCSTGVPVALDTWRVGVPLTLTIPAHPVTVQSPGGRVLCTVEVAAVTFTFSRQRITCPTTEGVACACRVSPITCEGCTFEFGGESLACRFQFTTTIDCMACPPVRGFGRITTRL